MSSSKKTPGAVSAAEAAVEAANEYMLQQGWINHRDVTLHMLQLYRKQFGTASSYYRDYVDAPRNHIARARMKAFNDAILLARLKGQL